jgi:23S rRNA (cytosine1962-C5)-methyltransferase
MPSMKATRHQIELESDDISRGPWIYGRQVLEPRDEVEPGSLVEIIDRSGRFVGHGLYNPGSDIRLRVLSRGKKSDLDQPRQFLLRRLASADRLRKKLLRLPERTDAYRVVHAEGDDLPGLIVDRFGDVLVCEYHSLGFYELQDEISWALGELYPGSTFVHRVPLSVRKAEGFDPAEEVLDVGEIEIQEDGLRFRLLPGQGHKTGFFCDQRDNRAKVAGFCKGANVLDLCCNIGGFALHAARAGARRVRAVDLDEVVLERAEASAAANQLPVEFIHADAFHVMRDEVAARRSSQVVVLDPHKIVRGKRMLEDGLAKYLDLNALALGCVGRGGLLATFSCSGAVELADFVGTVFRAARRAGREIRVLEVLGAAPDHPQRPDFPRSRYLKGLLLAVD